MSQYCVNGAPKPSRSWLWYFRLWLAQRVMPKEVRWAVVDVDKWPPMRCYTCRKEMYGVSVSGSPIPPIKTV